MQEKKRIRQWKKTKSELNEKVKAIEMELEKAKEEANKKTVGGY